MLKALVSALSVLGLVLAAAGCSQVRAESGGRALRSSDPGSGQFVRPGGPSPFACAADADCRPGPFVNPDNGCCDTGVHLGVFSKTYLDWRAGWMREHCGRVECPPILPPHPPEPCALRGRCAAGRCTSLCGPAAAP